MEVQGAIRRSIERTRSVLFRPVRVGAWFQYGLVFFLASFVDPAFGGFWGGGRFPRSGPHGPAPPFAWPHGLHSGSVIAIGAVALGAFLLLALAAAWIGCRGSMMAFRAVARGDAAEALSAFRELRAPANALFRSYAVIGLGSAAVGVPIAVHAAFTAFDMHVAGASDSAIAHALVFHAIAIALVAACAAFVLFFVRALVAPILFHLRCSATEAWRRTFRIVRENVASIVLYALARAVIGLVLGLASTLVTLCTCCVGGLPVLQQTILAPIYFFERAFTLSVLASVGGEYAEAI